MRRFSRESGFHVVMMSLMLTVLLGLFALVVTLGLLLSNRSKMQNATNLAALAAIEAFMASSGLSYAARADIALDRVNELLDSHSLIGASTLGEVKHKGIATDEEGSLEFGNYYPFEPTSGHSPCSNYPCYVPLPGPPSSLSSSTRANAVKVTARVPGSHPIILPFSELMGVDSFTLTVSASASTVERCTAMVLDVSPSVALATHQYTNDILVPLEDPGSLAYRESIVGDTGIERREVTEFGRACRPSDSPGSLNYKFFCAMPQSRRDDFDPDISHYRSDYRTVDSKNQRIRFDLFSTPEPMRTFLLGFNAGIRRLIDIQSSTDKFIVIAFNRTPVDRIPDDGLTTDLDYLLQITNLDNIGKVGSDGQFIPGKEPIHPNLIDRGWLSPIGGTGFTNLVQAFHEAIGALSNPDFCPASARKSIILASDGIMNCNFDRQTGASDCDLRYDIASGGTTNKTYLAAEQNLLGLTGSRGATDNPILYDLIQSKIRVTTMVSGTHVQPNFRNIWEGSPVNAFLDFEKAIARGYYGIPRSGPNDPNVFFNIDPDIRLERGPLGGYLIPPTGYEICTEPHLRGDPNRCAWTYAGAAPGVVFRRAIGVLGELSFRTGGVFCPLMPVWPDSSCYQNGVLRDCCRNGANPSCGGPGSSEGNFQTYALSDRGPAKDAVDCVLRTIGQNPYTLLPF